MSKYQLLAVPNFCIEHPDFGKIVFTDPVDLTYTNLADIVFFTHIGVDVYPNDKLKPPKGQKLNRSCHIVFYDVFC